MTGRFQAQGTPWEDLFDADIIGDGPQAYAFTDNGTPMRFAHIQYGSKRADIGATVRINGVDVDVTTLWAAKGTAMYVNTAAIPGTVLHLAEGGPGAVTATASIAFGRNGVASYNPIDYLPAQFLLPASATVGDAYLIRFRLIAKSSQGTVSGTLDAFLALDQMRQIALSYTRSNSGSLRTWAEIEIDIRRASDNADLHTYAVRMEAEAGIS